MTEHTRWSDSVAAYVLGALDDEERQGYEAHAESCFECREEISFLRVATDALPVSVAQHDAPAALKDRIMTVVNAEAELLRAAGPEADRARVAAPQKRDRRWWQFVPRSGLALAASVLLIVGGVTGYVLSDGGGSGSTGSRTVLAEVTFPTAPDATATLVVKGDHSTLHTQRIPRAGDGRVYQVWLMKKGSKAPQPTDALFTVSKNGTATVDVPGSLKDVQAVLVTPEPEGGSPAPTSEPVIAASLA
jgi:anti-sigma-K factor RskA